MPDMFGPDVINKLRTDPRTASYFSDPSFVETLKSVQKNPNNLQAFVPFLTLSGDEF